MDSFQLITQVNVRETTRLQTIPESALTRCNGCLPYYSPLGYMAHIRGEFEEICRITTEVKTDLDYIALLCILEDNLREEDLTTSNSLIK